MISFSEGIRIMITVCLAYFLGFDFCVLWNIANIYASIAHVPGLSLLINCRAGCCVSTGFYLTINDSFSVDYQCVQETIE